MTLLLQYQLVSSGDCFPFLLTFFVKSVAPVCTSDISLTKLERDQDVICILVEFVDLACI
jgi:hypothetical protein